MESSILVGLAHDRARRRQQEDSLLELAELARSADAEIAEVFLQERPRPDPAYLIGRGKVDEVRLAVQEHQAEVVIFDEEITPAQLRNLESALETRVIDRSELILDIFALRAHSAEGKLQVELAQLEYRLPRLSGRGTMLSRLGGGIGTRGPGETQLEVDRRRIRLRIARIKRDLKRLESRRALHRQKRRSVPIPTVSLVGYTNAGKSTLFNRLAESDTWVSAKMFATLDPLVRRIELPSGQEVLLSDTVGFIRKLPHTLVAAFHATLEEALEADLLLHVIDASQEDLDGVRQSVYQVLEEIGSTDTPVLEAYNKTDLLESLPRPDTSRDHVFISARRGDGIEALLERIAEILNRKARRVRLVIPFDRGEVVSQLHKRAQVEEEEYQDDGIHLTATLSLAELGRYRNFLEAEGFHAMPQRRKEIG
ncbi:MAG: GTPase HflX [Acidobacteriota bacterium]